MIHATLTPNEYAQLIRRRKGLKQSEVARMAGITRGLVTGFESGRVRLSDRAVQRLEAALEVREGELR